MDDSRKRPGSPGLASFTRRRQANDKMNAHRMLGAITTAAVVVVAAVTSSVTHTMLAADIRRSINERSRRLDWEDHCGDLDESGPDCFRRYLQKKAKTGKWQKRWFETNAHYLTYYKSKKMEKLLAALNLPQVGEIRLVDLHDDSYEEENDGSLFTIELNDRVYTMKASTREEAARWVEVLKVLQTMEEEESKTAEDPTASMMRNAQGSMSVTPGTASRSAEAWSKEPACCGLCACFTGN